MHPATGEIYVAGQTQSTDLPCTTSGVFCGPAAQPSLGGGVDGFIARFTPNLGRLLQTTYVGGPAADNVFALAIDPRSGDALVAGATGNATLACATQGGGCATGAQSSNPGGESGFVARFNASLTARIQATYLGGSAFDAIYALVVHPRTGEILVGGITASTDFPCTGGDRCAAGAQATSGGGQDGFVARLDAGLTRVLQATYMGGAGTDAIQTLAVHPQTGDVLVAGDTDSGNLACANRATCVQPPAGGGQDGFAARLSPDLSAADATPDPFDFAPDGNASPSTLRVSAPVRITGLSSAVPAYIEGTFGAAYCVSTAAGCACDASGGFTTAPGSIANGQYVCVRHVAPPIPDATTRTVLHAGGAAAAFTSATGPLSTGCSLDVDGNGAVDALTDGLVLLRAMLGLTGTAATQDAIGPGATRTGWTAIRGYLNASCGTGFAG